MSLCLPPPSKREDACSTAHIARVPEGSGGRARTGRWGDGSSDRWRSVPAGLVPRKPVRERKKVVGEAEKRKRREEGYVCANGKRDKQGRKEGGGERERARRGEGGLKTLSCAWQSASSRSAEMFLSLACKIQRRKCLKPSNGTRVCKLRERLSWK